MKRSGRVWARAAAWGAAAGLVALLSGDRGVTAPPPGIDPLEILNLQVKPNVLFIIDTSLSMAFTPDASRFVGGDDMESRFYKVKQAVRTVVASNEDKANMGMFSYNPDLGKIRLTGIEFDNTSGSGVPEAYRGGPFVYVSRDATAAAWNDQVPGGTNDELGFFNTAGVPPFNEYDNDDSFDIYRSLDNDETNFAVPYPVGCTPGTNCRYYMRSRRFRSGDLINWDPTPTTDADGNGTVGERSDGLVSYTAGGATCAAPPPGLLGDDTANANDGTELRTCFQLRNEDTGETTTYYFASATFGHEDDIFDPASSTPVSCGETGPVTPVRLCAAPTSNKAAFDAALRLELPNDAATGSPIGLTAVGPVDYIGGDCDGTAPDDGCPNVANAGMRTGFRTPLGASLQAALAHFINPVFLPANRPAAVLGLQKNFVILLTDGDETCPPGDTTAAVTAATALYGNTSPTGSVANDRIETLVVGFSPSVSIAPLNAIAQAGSGNTRNAYSANSLDELINALNAAIGETTATGTFSTESSITETIFEYGLISGIAGVDPLSPTTRFNALIPVLLQTSFDMPGYRGHLRAFINTPISGDPDGPGPLGVIAMGPTTAKWDAGEKLKSRVWYGTGGSDGMGDPTGTAVPGTNAWTFDQLHAGAGNAAAPIRSTSAGFSSARLKRRIYTSHRNGVFPYGNDVVTGAEQQPTPLWPPTLAVAPTDVADPAGSLDVALGISTLDLTTMRSQFGMCTGTVIGTGVAIDAEPTLAAHPCNNPALVLARTRRELRETILASAAGAEYVRDSAGNPARDTLGNLLYRAKEWPMVESTLAVPAVVPVPLEARPITHTGEYVLFRDGPRNASGENLNTCAVGAYPATDCISQGFGLRNPDKNAGAAAVSSTAIKPIMSVVYHATNAMVHAFRAGPRACAVGACPAANGEGGGEELWAFVPYDQLSKLRDRLLPQGRDPHTYMNASSIRFSDVFVPDPDGNGFQVGTRTFLGRWRTLMYFGRGIGGKHYTALDVTTVGPFNTPALDTHPPVLAWSRGNPDTQDSGGLANNLTNSGGVDLGVNDATAYAAMGQSWSVPAVAVVRRDLNYDKEFALFLGSGYSTNPAEGKTFYVMDALTGDVLYSDDVSTIPSTGVVASTQPNAIVANPSAFVPSQLAAGFVGNPAASQASLVYVGDLHGRVWKWITTSPSLGLVRIRDYTVDQPIANAVGLLSLASKPHVFLETGNDNRVDVPPNFMFAALRDDQADTNPTPDLASELFHIILGPRFTPDLTGYRGTAQPATAFNDNDQGRVFFVGTQFTPPGVTCISAFRSVVFALGAQSGAAAYDLSAGSGDADMFTQVDDRVNAVRGAAGEIILDKGKIGSSPDQLGPPPGAATAPSGTSGEVFVRSLKATSAVCR